MRATLILFLGAVALAQGPVQRGGLLSPRALGQSPINNMVISRGLVGYWPLAEGTGTSAQDFGGTLTGTWSGSSSPHYAAGTNGLSWVGAFNGTDDRLALGTSTILTAASAKSVFAWIKPDSAATCTFCRVLTHQITSEQWTLAMCPAGGSTATSIGGTPNNNSVFGCAPQNSVPLGEWSHVGWTFDGTTFTVYVNGVAQALNTTDGAFGFTAGTVNIGYRTSGSTTGNFKGQISDVRLYNRALQPGEVNAMYYSTAPVRTPRWTKWQGIFLGSRIESPGYLGNGAVAVGSRSPVPGHILYSPDHGHSWLDTGDVTGGAQITTRIVSSGNGVGYFGDCNGYAWQTTDYGAHWASLGQIATSAPTDPTHYPCRLYGALLVPATGTVLFADTAGNIHRTTNGGASFSHINPGGGTSALIFFSVMDTGYILLGVANGTLLQSTDDGANWSTLTMLQSSDDNWAICNLGAGRAAVGTKGGRIFVSSDSGATWAFLINFSTVLNDCSTDGGTGAVMVTEIADGPLFYSADRGATWTKSAGVSAAEGATGDFMGHLTYVDAGTRRYLLGVTLQGWMWQMDLP